MPAWRAKASATVQLFRVSEGVGGAAAPDEAVALKRRGGKPHQRHGVVHQALVGLARPIPFEQRELARMQRPAIAVRKTRAKSKMRLSPAARSFLAVNSGEVWR